MLDDLPDDATEIVDAQLPRADLVKAPAHGMPFFIAKSLDPQEPDVPFVAKSDAEDTLDTAVAAPKLGDERPTDHPGDPDDPTSAAWEAVDAAGGRAAVNALVALKDIVAGLLERESVEDFTGSDDEACVNTYDLDSVLSALDFALGVLAPFAVTEQAEADDRAEDALIKASAALVTATATVADATGIAKAGRVLSASNEAAIRGAVDSLTKVLDSLPAAKEADVTKADETVEPTEDVTKAEADVTETVVKADSDLSELSDDDLRRLAITGEDGQRTAALAEIGLRTLTGMKAEPDDDDADPADVKPDEPAEGDDTTDATAPTVAPEAVTKSTDEETDSPADAIQKALADQKTELDSVVKALQDRIDALEQSPAPSRVLSNGAVPPEHVLRGQDAPDGGKVAKAVEIAKGIEDPDERQAALAKILTARYTA